MQHPSEGPAEGWCLVLAVWGEKYRAVHVNELARRARALSPSLVRVVLYTDRLRDGIDANIHQTLFPAYFAWPEFFGGAYRAKLAVFSRLPLPSGVRCLYVDLDTVITGDLGRIAALAEGPDEVWMMPPAGLGFGAARRLVDRLRGGKHYPVGNSSLVAFHPDAEPNIAEAFHRRHADGIDVTLRYMHVDDVFISWLMRGRLRGIPNTLAVSFRREFMARARLILWLRHLSPRRRNRRKGLVAVTFNGLAVKPELLVDLPDGELLRDGKGRIGYWNDRFIGPVRQQIIASYRRILSDR